MEGLMLPESKIAFITEILSRTDRKEGLELSSLATDGLLSILREINDALTARSQAKVSAEKIHLREGEKLYPGKVLAGYCPVERKDA
jgi:hypothetical protein